MVSESDPPVLPLEQVTQAAEIEGFTAEDFAIFEVPGFAARMPLLRAQIKPKLAAIGDALTPRLSTVLDETLHPHVAQHLRRTVNAPEETWVAFARSPRAYKPFVHLRAAVSADQMRVLVFLEDDADDKATFAANLKRNAEALSAYLTHHPTIRAFELRDTDGEPKRGRALTAEALHAFAERLERVKGQHASFGVAFDKSHPVLLSGLELLDSLLEVAADLKPLYDCGASPEFTYTYTPEVINL